MKAFSRTQQNTNKPHHHKQHPRKNFKAIMTEVTHSMPRYRRVFSGFIHARTVETLSDLIGRTIARPNAILCGAVFSFTLTLAVYLLSKNFGYSLSGFESIGTFFIGWSVGTTFDIITSIFRKE